MTEYARPEGRLRTAQLRALLGLLDVGVLILDGQLRVAHANPALIHLLGLGVSPGSLTGSALPAGPATYAHAYAEPRRARARVEATIRHARPAHGDEYPMSGGRLIAHDYTPVTLEGTTAGHVWILREITGPAAPVPAPAERAEPGGERDVLVAVAHELRTPTASVAAAIELLDVTAGPAVAGSGTPGSRSGPGGPAEAGPGTPAAVSEDERLWAARTVRRNAQRMLRLTDDLILLADLETSSDPIGDAMIDLAELVRRAAAEARQPAQATIGAPGTREDSKAARAVLVGDPPLLRRAVDAAIAIAGAMGASTEPVSVSATPARTGWTITVSAPIPQPVTTERMITTKIPMPDDPECSRSAALALLLARAIIARHGGSLTTPTTARDFVITLSLPTNP